MPGWCCRISTKKHRPGRRCRKSKKFPHAFSYFSEFFLYWEVLAQIELADRVGFDYVWEVEPLL
jgi:hypothetical protein